MERFRDCTLCKVTPRAEAARCKFCSGKLTGRDRLLHEIYAERRLRGVSVFLSTFAAGLGQAYRNRWLTAIGFAVLIPLCLGLLYITWGGFSYSHFFVIGAAIFVLIVAAADAWYGPTLPTAPCQKTCPAGVPIPDYLQMIIDEEFEQGHSFIRSRIPLAGVIGRVCPHPCETACFRGVDGEPIAINACKRYLADKMVAMEYEEDKPDLSHVPEGPKVAIVGAGPSGLACAYYLAVLGARPTILDAEQLPGGRLATTIPDFRLPADVLAAEVAQITGRGAQIKSNTRIGPDGIGVGELMKDYDALYMAIGAPESIALNVEGSEGFTDFQDVLRDAKMGETATLSGRVAVVGGGNAAIDVCRTALRCGAEEVHLLYRRDRTQMPARDDEVEAAMREGVHFHYLINPVRVVHKDDKLRGIVVVDMELGPPDSTGRPRPVPVEGSDRLMDFGTIIPCLGQDVAGTIFDDPALAKLQRDGSGRVVVNESTCRTSLKNIYAGGDMVRGAQTAVAAMADGRRAALSIYADLAGKLVKSNRWRNLRIRADFPGHVETPQEKIREEMRCTPLRGRIDGFEEVEEGFYAGQALRESRRCLQCHREL